MLVRDASQCSLNQPNASQIGINLGDPVFRGEYHGSQRHEDDFEDVLQRALDAGCKKFMVTGSDLKESEHAIELAKAHRKVTFRELWS
jgi:TatD DNase family protein